MSTNTAEKIVTSMYDLMSDVGYEKASINQICKNIGVTKSSFYHFFESKEQVLVEVVKTSYNDDFAKTAARLNKISTLDEYKMFMQQLGEDAIDSYLNDEKLRKVCAEIDLIAERIPEIKELVDTINYQFFLFIKKTIQHGVNIGAFPKDFEVELNAEVLITVLIGLDAIILHDIQINAKNVVRRTIDQMF